MSDQTIHSPAEANGKPILVGDRGGLKTKDEFKTNNDREKTKTAPPKKPCAICKGPGYDIGFFKLSNGYDVRYKGPNCDDVLKRIKSYLDDGVPINEAVERIHMED